MDGKGIIRKPSKEIHQNIWKIVEKTVIFQWFTDCRREKNVVHCLGCGYALEIDDKCIQTLF